MPEKSIYGGSEKDYSGIMSKPSSRPTEMFEVAARPQVKEKVQRDIKQEVQRKQQEPQGPVGFSGGNWNGGFEKDEDSMRERILDDHDISNEMHLVNTIKKYMNCFLWREIAILKTKFGKWNKELYEIRLLVEKQEDIIYLIISKQRTHL